MMYINRNSCRICSFLLQDSKEDFLNRVERENPKVKHDEFVDFCEVSIIY